MIRKRLLSFKYAFQGIATLFRTQPNALIHLLAAGIAIAAGWYLGLTTAEWGLIAICIGLVLAAESFNTALEFLTDLVSPQHHPLAGKTKDVAAAGVLFCAFAALATGLLIFVPKIIALLS